MTAPPSPGIHLVHKPVGHTSFQLVQAFMEEVRLSGLRRDKLPVSHAGALDPFASGLVLLLAGQATRLMDLIHPAPKTYLATVAWGLETDNGDLLGQPVSRGDPSGLTEAQLDAALQRFTGWHDQVPPAFSNKRVGGERAYEKAHRGEEVVLPPSRVYLHSAELVRHELPGRSTLRLVTGGGYYVRSLARDLGRALGCFAHLQALAREQIGPWRDPGEGPRVALRGRALFPWCRSRSLSPRELAQLRNGEALEPGAIEAPEWPLPPGYPDPDAPIRGFAQDGLHALLREREGKLHAAPLLKAPL